MAWRAFQLYRYCITFLNFHSTSNLVIQLSCEDDYPMPKKEQFMGVIKHKHCGICGISIPHQKSFCSRECEEKEKKISKRRTYTFIFTLLLTALKNGTKSATSFTTLMRFIEMPMGVWFSFDIKLSLKGDFWAFLSGIYLVKR